MKETIGMTIIAVVLIVLIGLLVKSSIDRQKWLDAHCSIIGEMSGSSTVGVGPTFGGSSGMSVTSVYIPGKTGYKCDDDRIIVTGKHIVTGKQIGRAHV